MNTKHIYAAILTVVTSGAISGAAYVGWHQKVDAIACAKSNPNTPAVQCLITDNDVTNCQCITRVQYATLVRDLCNGKGVHYDKVCDEGLKKDLLPPPPKTHRFTVYTLENKNDMIVAADSTILDVSHVEEHKK